MDIAPIPITIIGGFLGSGKTSLLNHVINNTRGKRFAVLVNDFGEINIDAKLVVSVEGETISLANGCVCCVIRDDLLKEVLRLAERVPLPEHIVIETSGVARPISVAETFLSPAVHHLVETQNMITMLDADLVIDDQADYTDIAYGQIAVADLVVINKTDLVSPRQIEEVRKKVETIVPRARIWETTFGEVPLELIFDDVISRAAESLRENSKPIPTKLAHNHHEEFATWTFRSKAKWSFNAIQRAVEHLPKGIFRAKGMVQLDLDSDDYGILQVTGRRSWLRLMQQESDEDEGVTTELVFIGKPGTATNDSIKAHFENALEEANTPDGEGYVVTDLRAFNVIFA